MRVGFVVFEFPAWTETFIRRYVCSLRDLGHTIRVFVLRDPPDGPSISTPTQVTKAMATVQCVKEFAPDVLYASLSLRAIERAIAIGQELDLPYIAQVWSGLDSFRHTTATAAILRPTFDDSLCRAILVEDSFMAAWAVNRLEVQPSKLLIVPNSLDLTGFDGTHNERDPLTVLNVSRFVPKKGLQYLVPAMTRCDADLWLVGAGLIEDMLRKAAGQRVSFLGVQPESSLGALYCQAAIYAAPCIRDGTGDADGVPTTVLEAMACGCPIVASDLLSMSEYVVPRRTGLLVPPGDVTALVEAVSLLLKEKSLRRELGEAGRIFAREHLDICKNIKTIEGALRG